MSVNDLEREFKKLSLPKTLVFNQCTTIIDVEKFIDVHITTLKANSGNKRFLPYYDRLLKVYLMIKEK